VIRTDDHNPPHVHVIHASCEAKINIANAEVVYTSGFHKNDMRDIRKYILNNKELLMEAWNEIHSKN